MIQQHEYLHVNGSFKKMIQCCRLSIQYHERKYHIDIFLHPYNRLCAFTGHSVCNVAAAEEKLRANTGLLFVHQLFNLDHLVGFITLY